MFPITGAFRLRINIDNVFQVNNFELTIKASDGLLSSETVVIVDVLDVNDCPPKFSESNYSAVIQVGLVKQVN